MFKKILSVVLALTMLVTACIGLASCTTDDNENKGLSESPLAAPELKADFQVDASFKIGFIFLHDENSTYDKNFIDAANNVKKALNLKDEQVIFKTNIPESSACYDAAIDLANQGCKIVFADSFGHEQFLIQAANEKPDVQFCHATGTRAQEQADAGVKNYHNAFASIYQGRYLAGIVAGMKLNEMISNGKITADKAVMGYVGAFTYAEVVSGFTSFYLGAKSVCPSVTMKVQYTGSWYDQAKEQEAANALITSGCVLISQHADSMGAPNACEVAGVPNVSYNGSTYDACQETFLVSSAINWAPYFMYIIKCVNTNAEIKNDWCGGISEGSVVLSGINKGAAAEGTEAKVKEAIDQFKAGTLHVFDVSKDNFILVNGQKVTSHKVTVIDKDGEDTTNDVILEVVKDGYFDESGVRSAPYFDIIIDGIENVNVVY